MRRRKILFTGKSRGQFSHGDFVGKFGFSKPVMKKRPARPLHPPPILSSQHDQQGSWFLFPLLLYQYPKTITTQFGRCKTKLQSVLPTNSLALQNVFTLPQFMFIFFLQIYNRWKNRNRWITVTLEVKSALNTAFKVVKPIKYHIYLLTLPQFLGGT